MQYLILVLAAGFSLVVMAGVAGHALAGHLTALGVRRAEREQRRRTRQQERATRMSSEPDSPPCEGCRH